MTGNAAVVLRKPDDVLRLIDSGRIRPKNPVLVKIVALGSIFVDGWDLSSFGLGTVQITSEFNLTNSGISLHSLPFISTVILIGAMVGGLFGGYLTDRVGRTKMLMITLFLLVGATVLSATAPNPELFCLWRFLMGVGVGLDVPVALAFVAEYSAISNKGRNVTMAQVMSTSAAAVAFFAIIPFHFMGIGDQLWRWSIGLGAVPALIVLVLRFIYTAESPMWAAKYEGLDKAAEILRKNYGLEVTVEEDGGRAAQQKERFRPGSLLALFRSPYTARTVLVSILVVCQAAQYYAISLYTPKIFDELFPGDIIVVLVLSGAVNVIGAIGALGCVAGTQRLGLRRLGLIGFSITAGCLAIISGAFHLLAASISVILIALFSAAHNFGAGYVGTAMGTLSYPTAIRGIGGGYTQAITRVGGIIGAFAFPVLLDAQGMRFTIGAIVLAPLVAIAALLLIRWDPVGKDVEEHGDEDTTAPTTVGADRAPTNSN
ncbi:MULTISPECIES: MFS transporter [Saccharopolyspora]|uniref:MFS family permease n=2 Tax=Saccharopolyspora TaxID=1835 RepID=A0A853AHY1_9PSEU|nr:MULTISPECIES: MFS transporter [Saccharopolyspora]KAA5828362.1 sugar porter family MFS transporter [Saccharopolyspora hirsuta]NYI84234.1 MFS family permease [Saccharopolyspora hordei]